MTQTPKLSITKDDGTVVHALALSLTTDQTIDVSGSAGVIDCPVELEFDTMSPTALSVGDQIDVVFGGLADFGTFIVTETEVDDYTIGTAHVYAKKISVVPTVSALFDAAMLMAPKIAPDTLFQWRFDNLNDDSKWWTSGMNSPDLPKLMYLLNHAKLARLKLVMTDGYMGWVFIGSWSGARKWIYDRFYMVQTHE